MFVWTQEMVDYMRDASEYSGSEGTLVAHIAPFLSKDAHICDAGCGLGYLSLALSPYCAHVDAVDISNLALGVLRENIARRGIKNVSPILCDAADLDPKKRYDAMVFCQYGGTAEALGLARAHCRGKAILIKKNWENHRFTLDKKPLEGYTFANALKILDALGIPYEKEIFQLEMGQPFRSLEDAVAFFRIYSRDEDPASITAAEIAGKLETLTGGEFAYYLPASKPFGMLAVDVADIPDSI